MIQEKLLRRIGNVRDIDDGGISKVEVKGKSILLIKRGSEVYAIDSICGEGCGPLDNGVLEGFCIRCRGIMSIMIYVLENHLGWHTVNQASRDMRLE
jgi:hypothetical protein